MFLPLPQDEGLRLYLHTLDVFCEREMKPARLASIKNGGQFPSELIPALAESGLFGLSVPEEFGGTGRGALWSTWTALKLAYEWAAGHLIWGAQTSLGMRPIEACGNVHQKNHFIPRMVTGEFLGCYCLTEPNAGSDAKSIRTKASEVKGGYRLNGEKTFITNATHARVAIVVAKTENGISTFIIETSEPGLKDPDKNIRVQPIDKWVLAGSPYSQVFFDDVFVPDDALLGEEGKAFGTVALSTLELGRINIAAQAIGIAMCLFDEAVTHVTSRVQFNQRIWDNKDVQQRLAGVRSELVAAWALTLQVSEMVDRGEKLGDLASCAKLFATEAAARAELVIAPFFGGMGVSKGHRLEELRGGIHVARVYEGAREVQELLIARSIVPR